MVDVQLTVVWPELGFWTSMLEPLSAATLPVAPIGAFVVVAAPAAPGVVAMAATATSAPDPAPRNRTQRRRFVLWLVGVCMAVLPLSFSGLVVLMDDEMGYSLRRASMGAMEAALLAGYTPKRTPMARAMASAPTAAVGLVEMGSPIRPGR